MIEDWRLLERTDENVFAPSILRHLHAYEVESVV